MNDLQNGTEQNKPFCKPIRLARTELEIGENIHLDASVLNFIALIFFKYNFASKRYEFRRILLIYYTNGWKTKHKVQKWGGDGDEESTMMPFDGKQDEKKKKIHRK